jgi:hypothetical protein
MPSWVSTCVQFVVGHSQIEMFLAAHVNRMITVLWFQASDLVPKKLRRC